jgi:hypothetical protein
MPGQDSSSSTSRQSAFGSSAAAKVDNYLGKELPKAMEKAANSDPVRSSYVDQLRTSTSTRSQGTSQGR